MTMRWTKARRAACAQVWPISGTYRWQGRVERASGHRLEAKTSCSVLPRSNSSFESGTAMWPEIIADDPSLAVEPHARLGRERRLSG
jgi:uncharacterized protein involved in tolerance to divalent cations